MSWYLLAILSALFWGTENFLHKISAKKGLNSSKVSAIFGLSVCILSLIFFLVFRENLFNFKFLIIISILNALTFFTSFITRLEALKRIDSTVYFPVSKTGTLLIMVLLSIFVLHERITIFQLSGLVTTLIAIFLLTENSLKEIKIAKLAQLGIGFTIVSTIFAALANFTVDIASNKVGTYAFSFFAYSFGFLFSSAINRLSIGQVIKSTPTTVSSNENTTITYILGVAIGTFNFLGLVFFIEALKAGTFSVVGAINNFSLILTLGLSILIYSERPSKKQIIGICLAFASLFLLNK